MAIFQRGYFLYIVKGDITITINLTQIGKDDRAALKRGVDVADADGRYIYDWEG